MGILARRMDEAIRGAGDDVGWYTRDDDVDGGRLTSSGVRVTSSLALSLTTVWRCVDLLSSAVSQAPRDVIVKVGGRSFPEFQKPAWLTMPNPLDPSYTANDYFAQVALSLLMDGNFFVVVLPSVYDPQFLKVLPPGQVEVKQGPVYELKDRMGRPAGTFGPGEMLHGTWIRPPGRLRGISPLEVLRRSIGGAVAAEEHASRFFGQGASLSFGVEVPGKLEKNQKDELREQLRRKYAGMSNSHAIGVLDAGAKFVPGLAPTPEQAQMLDTREFAVDDLCRPFGVPPSMAGSQRPGASAYASADVHREEFRDYAVLPLATRIEAHHNRLVQVPDSIDDPNASAQFKFNLDHVARTNLLARAQADGEKVSKGILTPDEARAHDDLPPLPGGDRLYMQQQMVPLSQIPAAPAAPALEAASMDDKFEVRSSDLWEGTRFTVDGEGTGFTMDGPMAVYSKPSVVLTMADLNASSRSHLQRMGGRTFREVLHPGAFAKSLAESPDIVLLTQHNQDGIPLGRTKAGTLRLTEEAGMVRAQADLPDNELGRPVRDAVHRGDLGGLSYRHGKLIENWKTETLADGWHGPVRHIHEIQLRREISLVTFPGYDTPTAIRQLAEDADVEPDELAAAFEVLRNPEARLTNEQRDLVMTAVNARVDEPYVPLKSVQMRERLGPPPETVLAAG